MSQVDYIHFFSNIFWSSTFLWIIYLILCIYYIQNIYKILRLRNLVLVFFTINFKSNFINWNLISLGVFFFFNLIKNYMKNSIFFLLNKTNIFLKIICL